MKICFFVQNLYTLGGVQRVITSIVNKLSEKEQYKITVVMPLKNSNNKILFKIDEKIKIKPIEELITDKTKTVSKYVLALNKRVPFLKGIIGYRYIKKHYYSAVDKNKVIKYINNNSFDIVIGVGFEYSLLLGDISNRIVSKTIGWQHSTYEYYLEHRGVAGYGIFDYAKECYENLDKVLVLTNADKKMFDANLGIDSIVNYNPVQKMQTKNDRKYNSILFAGRLVWDHKGLDFLVEVLKIIRINIPDFKCNIVGDGKDKNWLVKQIEKKGLNDNVNFVGNTDDMNKYYQCADVMLQTSRWEGFGMTITEAMSAGVPVVAFHNNGPDEIIEDSKNGFLIEKYDIKKFAMTVVELLKNDSLREEVSKMAIARANDFSLDELLPIFEQNIMG